MVRGEVVAKLAEEDLVDRFVAEVENFCKCVRIVYIYEVTIYMNIKYGEGCTLLAVIFDPRRYLRGGKWFKLETLKDFLSTISPNHLFNAMEELFRRG